MRAPNPDACQSRDAVTQRIATFEKNQSKTRQDPPPISPRSSRTRSRSVTTRRGSIRSGSRRLLSPSVLLVARPSVD